MRLPSLLETYTEVERRLDPRLQTLSRTPSVLRAVVVLTGTRRGAGRALTALNAGLLHAVNLPAGSDVAQLRREVGELDHQLRRLRLDLTSTRGEALPGVQ